MKIRNGFVSNSSSSSFCIYGESVDIDRLKSFVSASEDDENDIENYLHEIAKAYRLQYVYDYALNTAYFGLSPDKLKDDETGAQFKERVKKSLDALLLDNTKPQWFCDVIENY